MSNPLAMAAQLGGSAIRFGAYYGMNRLVDRRTRALGRHAAYAPERPVPTTRELLADLGRLYLADAAAVRDGLYPATVDEGFQLPRELARLRRMLAELPEALERRQARDASTAKAQPEADRLPSYYTQDFHFQAGGYLTEDSARLYDVQVETLFYGSANAMRRSALRPIAEHLAGCDQRRLTLVDVACGTGRFLRQVRLAFPAIGLTGLDLSQAYLDEAARHLRGLRPAMLIQGNAEAMALPDASQDVATCIYLFHEVPPDVRRTVAAELARVLKPGGLLVLIDSLQMGDRPGWDGLLEAFPVRFHEPYFRNYVVDDLDGLLTAAGLLPVATSTAFLSKVMVRVKAPQAGALPGKV